MKNKEVDRYVNTKLKKYCNCSVFWFLVFLYESELDKKQIPPIEQHSDLNDIYCQTDSDTTLYKPIKDGWHIMLDHDH